MLLFILPYLFYALLDLFFRKLEVLQISLKLFNLISQPHYCIIYICGFARILLHLIELLVFLLNFLFKLG
jgi:hypothetical protein